MRTLAFGSATRFTPATIEGSESGLVPASFAASPASALAPASFSSATAAPASWSARPASLTPASARPPSLPASASASGTSASGAPASTRVFAGSGFFFGLLTTAGSPGLAGSAAAAGSSGALGGGGGASSIRSMGIPVMGGASTSSAGGDQRLSKPTSAAQGVSGTCNNNETTRSFAKRPVLVSAVPRQ